jgi:hypothetical protein
VPTETGEPEPIIITGANEGRPKFAQSVITPGGLSGDIKVLAINGGLALLSLILLVLSSELFNKTVEEHHYTLSQWLKPIAGPFEGVGGAIAKMWNSNAGESWLGAIGPPLAILGLAGIIYGGLEPGLGFNEKSLVMMITTVTTVTVLTYFYNGGQIIVSHGLFRLDAAIRLFPLGVLVAIFCVIASRVDGFQPGIIYGFIASAVIVGATEPTKEQSGKVIFYPVLALLGLCALAWFLISPFRDFANDNEGWWAALPESIAVGIFVGGLEGTFFQMIPLRYMDGHKLWSWNKAAWAAVAALTAFMFWDVLLREQNDSMSTITKGTPLAAIIAMVICFALSLTFYAYFRWRGPDVVPESVEA